MTVKYRTVLLLYFNVIKGKVRKSLMFTYFNLCLSVMLESLSCSFISIYFLTGMLVKEKEIKVLNDIIRMPNHKFELILVRFITGSILLLVDY